MSRFSIDAVFNAVDKFTAPVDRFQNRVKRFSQSATASLKRVDRGFTNIIKGAGKFGAVAVGSLIALGTAATAAITALNRSTTETTKMANAVGLSASTVEGLSGAVADAGFEFDHIIDLAEEMNNKIGESRALGQTLPVQESLAALGLRFKEIKDLAPEEQFRRITDAALKMGDAQKAASAVDILMGGEANKVISVLRQQGASVQEIVNRYNALNLQTDKSRQGAEKFTNAIGFMTGFLSSLGKMIAGLVGARLEPMLRQFQAFIATNKELIQLKVEQWIDNIATGVMFLVDNFEDIVKWTKRIGIGIGIFLALSAALKIFIGVMTAVNIVMAMNPIGLIVLAIVALIAAISAVVVYWDELKAAFLDLPASVKIAVAAVTGPIGWMVGAASLIMDNWEPIKEFFVSLWDGIVATFNSAISSIKDIIDSIMEMYDNTIGAIGSGISAVGDFFGFGGDDEDDETAASSSGRVSTISPQERTARMISETNRTERSEVVIRDETGRAEITRTGTNAPLKMQRSGAF